jgi:integrase
VELRARGLAESTVRIAYDILLAILETALRDGALGRNPVAAVKRPRVTRHEASYLTPDQVRRALGGRRHPLRAAFTLLVNTGLRRGEALALQWSDVDLEAGTLRVRGTLARVNGKLEVTEPETAAKSKRAVPLSEVAVRTLRAVVQSKLRSVSGPALDGIRPVLCSSLSLVSHASHVTLCGLSTRPPSVRDYRARWACTRCATLPPQ